jgi:hypothetical protein
VTGWLQADIRRSRPPSGLSGLSRRSRHPAGLVRAEMSYHPAKAKLGGDMGQDTARGTVIYSSEGFT